MKRTFLYLLGVVLLLTACSPAQVIDSPQSSDGGNTWGSTNPNPPSQPQANNPPSGGGGNQIVIPSYNQQPTNGILDQLAWLGTGGCETCSPKPPCGSCSINMNGSAISFRNFRSSQRLIVLFYRYTGHDSCLNTLAKYVTEQTVQVDSSGNLDVSLSGAIDSIFVNGVYDASTGQAELNGTQTLNQCLASNNNAPSNGSADSCPGAPAQRVHVGGQAYVCTSSDAVHLREKAGKQYEIIKSLIPGADLSIVGGPKCSDNWYWWKVQTESGFVGWMAEGGDSIDRYFICPR